MVMYKYVDLVNKKSIHNMGNKGINMSVSVLRQKQAIYTSYVNAGACHKWNSNAFSSLLNYWNSFGFEEQIT